MRLVWDKHAWEDYLWWQSQDRKVLRRISGLIKVIERSGNEGIGTPEPLKARVPRLAAALAGADPVELGSLRVQQRLDQVLGLRIGLGVPDGEGVGDVDDCVDHLRANVVCPRVPAVRDASKWRSADHSQRSGEVCDAGGAAAAKAALLELTESGPVAAHSFCQPMTAADDDREVGFAASGFAQPFPQP